MCVQDDELDFAHQQRQSVIQHKQQWEHDAAEKQRLVKMQEDHQQFQHQIMSRRQGEFEELQVQHYLCSSLDSEHHLVSVKHVQCAGRCNRSAIGHCHLLSKLTCHLL